ncbi:MAG: radical SAM protein [Streptococcaceae bacterium]|jgi:MoaA/NifB/PqqE/SkfB family radical SAM enzyme|nr:radical SAM protein [Streptococcaceae bacterium]
MFVKWNLTKKCKMNCKFCHNALDRIGWDFDIDEDSVEKVVKKIGNASQLKGVSLLGGDPLEYEHILKVCKNLDTYRIPYGFITAGENIYTGKFDEIFSSKYCHFVGLSIDSSNKKTVKYIRGKDILNKQLGSLDHLLEIKKTNPNLKIHTNTILMNINKGEIIDTIQLFSSKNVNKIQILGYQNNSHSKDRFNINFSEELEFVLELSKFLNMQGYLLNRESLELCFLSEIGKDYLNSLLFDDNQITYGNSSVCPIFRESLFVSNDGFVYPCDAYKPYFEIDKYSQEPTKIYPVDNLREKSIDKIYNENEFFIDIKEKIMEKDLYSNWEPCNSCSHLMKNCFPCLLNEVNNKSNEVLIEKCKEYKFLLKS